MAGFDLENFLPYQLARVASRVSAEFSKRYTQRFGLSVAEWRIIAHLSQVDCVSVRDLEQRADLEKSMASRAAARLEGMGLITKRPDETDRRLVALSLTEQGRKLITEMTPVALEYEADLVARLSPEEKMAFDRVLRLLTLPRTPNGAEEEACNAAATELDRNSKLP
ncbi:MAG: MarR family transcriptional regulator [Neomegalonema sp.]|nr:MarR family transcriptional regulator [Neomegalonema sp.]